MFASKTAALKNTFEARTVFLRRKRKTSCGRLLKTKCDSKFQPILSSEGKMDFRIQSFVTCVKQKKLLLTIPLWWTVLSTDLSKRFSFSRLYTFLCFLRFPFLLPVVFMYIFLKTDVLALYPELNAETAIFLKDINLRVLMSVETEFGCFFI